MDQPPSGQTASCILCGHGFVHASLAAVQLGTGQDRTGRTGRDGTGRTELLKNLVRNLFKNPAENLLKNLVKNLIKNLAKNPGGGPL